MRLRRLPCPLANCTPTQSSTDCRLHHRQHVPTGIPTRRYPRRAPGTRPTRRAGLCRLCHRGSCRTQRGFLRYRACWCVKGGHCSPASRPRARRLHHGCSATPARSRLPNIRSGTLTSLPVPLQATLTPRPALLSRTPNFSTASWIRYVCKSMRIANTSALWSFACALVGVCKCEARLSACPRLSRVCLPASGFRSVGPPVSLFVWVPPPSPP